MNGKRYQAALLAALLATTVARGQVLQLPTFHRFGVGTSVLVPDRGSAYLGGVGRATYAGSHYGVPAVSSLPSLARLFGNRSTASVHSHSGASVHVTVIDLAEMDRAVLARAATTATTPMTNVRALDIAREIHVQSASNRESGAVESVATIRRENERRREAVSREGREFFQRGTDAEAAGKFGAAKIYYKMALRRLDAAHQKLVTTRLKQLERRSVK